ncbi:MAG: dephospho-CoA kinase [Methylovulum sp.]|nr:dephospho-CoA kinase [Methylovulum sp.]
MLKIGLTGGIGCGKSTVANIFTQLDVPVIDADELARQLVATGRPALFGIQQVFGAGIFNLDGSLDRVALREVIFSDPTAKQRLEAILHPLIYQTIKTDIARLAQQNSAAYCIICLPLLFETGKAAADVIDRILVIDCPVEEQMARVKKRDHLTTERIQSIIDSQVSRSFRLSLADDVIDNSMPDDGLAERVKKLHNLYLSISEARI